MQIKINSLTKKLVLLTGTPLDRNKIITVMFLISSITVTQAFTP